KVGSGQTTDWPFIRAVADAGKPVILSTGMARVLEIERAERMLKDAIACTLQCTTEYPCPAEHIGLNQLTDSKFEGLSDHSGTIYPGICAAYLGAKMVEVHVCWDRRQFGADVGSSLTIDELSQLVEGIRFATAMRQNPVCKNRILKELDDTQVYI
ncbi:MAG: N-acetylneuraminate synthase, partial [Planctomycetales bacterium]|nr:N-acetylneuraminate synthase [Planctomycetales bacterium]